jgi:(5-formylfuran-3-yl)methyl phosphate synthase
LPSNRSWPLLMTSVADVEEAATALRAGVDILDVKDPREGSLGACPPPVLRAIVALRDRTAVAGRRVPVSAALGDATNHPGTFALAASGAAACGVDYLKIGLRGLRDPDDSVVFLSVVVEAARAAAPGVRVVAAAYAEAAALGAIEPAQLPAVATRSGADGCLIDTALKDGRTLFDHLDPGAVSGFVAACRQRGLLCGLAGSLGPDHLQLLLEIGPDVIGVRGAICEGGRSGRLDPGRLSSMREALIGAIADRHPSGA